MSVIVELALSRDSFKLGRILPILDDIEYSLEAIVPLGEAPIPFLRVYDGKKERLVDEVTDHPAVHEISLTAVAEGEEMYRLDWEHETDEFLSAISDCGGHLLSGNSHRGRWQFQVEFPDHDAVSAFEETLSNRGIEDEILSVANPWVPGQRTADQLTGAQQEALALALRNGYYDIPRRCSTAELADQLGISDQAVSERLRRGMAALLRSTIANVGD